MLIHEENTEKRNALILILNLIKYGKVFSFDFHGKNKIKDPKIIRKSIDPQKKLFELVNKLVVRVS